MTKRGADRKFRRAGTIHLVAEAEDHCGRALGRTVTAKPRGAIAYDQWNIRESLHIVHDGRLAEEARNGRIWRLLPRLRRLAFDHLESCGIFAGDIHGGRELNRDLNGAEIPGPGRFSDR